MSTSTSTTATSTTSVPAGPESWTPDADRALKARHRAMWASGDYPTLAHELISDLGPRLVAAAGVTAGQRVLDVAAGSGNVALPAAHVGADVVAGDLTPELLDAGRRQAADEGLAIDWRVADAEALPFADDSFDVVLSCVGVMFAPHHQLSADELVRVCRPGGTIGLINWTPEGFIGQLFATMRPYVPAPPPGVQPPPLWGREDHVQQLLGDRVTDLRTTREVLHVGRFGRPEDFRDYFKSHYGPTIAAYRGLADDADRVAALDGELAGLAARHTAWDASSGGPARTSAGEPERMGSGEPVSGSAAGPGMSWEYLLLTARKRS